MNFSHVEAMGTQQCSEDIKPHPYLPALYEPSDLELLAHSVQILLQAIT